MSKPLLPYSENRNNMSKPKANILTTRPENDLELIQRIGSGTYGEVYKANVKATGALAAVKIINIEAGDDFDIIQQEIIIMQDCQHPNIVQYFGSYLRREKLWIAMEFCGGGSLQDIYHVTGALTEPMIGFTCAEMLKGLHYMHNQKKLHRDIKGANILLTSEGDVKLADFGVGAQITSTVGKRSSFIGTPYWMAPEVAAVERTGGYDHLCDIWAVGITAIELAECQPPLFELHPMRALYLISKRNYTPPTLKTAKGKWTNHFKDFLKQSLTKNPKKRPDAEKLLNHVFCKENGNKRPLLRDLLDSHEKLKEKKKNKMYTTYSSDEETEKKDEKVEKESEPEKKVTVKRIQSKKEKRRKDRQPPARNEEKSVEQRDGGLAEEISKAHISDGPLPSDRSEETVDTATIKAPPKKDLPPLPPPPTSNPPPIPPQRPPPPPSVDSRYVDATPPVDGRPPPPVPPRHEGTLKAQGSEETLEPSENPPPLPPRSPMLRKKLHNERPQSQLFTQKAAKNCFSKIFNECPLKMNHAASWKNPDTKSNILLFASTDGIYSLNLEDTSNIELVLIFSRPCKWVCVVKNMLVSICGVNTTSVYMHNLVSLHTPRESVDKIPHTPKGVAFTVKIPGTSNTLKCCVAHNLYNNEIYLYAGRRDGVMLLQWYEPLQKFMIVKDVKFSLPPDLPIFEPIVKKGLENTTICVGAYMSDNGEFILDEVDIESEKDWEPKPDLKRIDIKALSQLEPNNILIAYGKTVQFIGIDGKPLLYSSKGLTKLNFEDEIENAICLPGSVMTFSKHGVEGKGFNEQITASHKDGTRLYKLLCSDRIVVLESFDATEKQSNLFILASEQGGR